MDQSEGLISHNTSTLFGQKCLCERAALPNQIKQQLRNSPRLLIKLEYFAFETMFTYSNVQVL